MKKKNSEKTVTEHKTKQNPLVFIGSVLLLVIITIAFVFTGGVGTPTSNEIIEFGTYDGTKIIYDEDFVNTTEYIMEQMQMYGQEADMFSAMSQAFQDSVLTLAYIDEVEKAGYILPESKVNREMIQFYVDEEGNYSEMLFQQTPESTRSQIKVGTEETLMKNVYAADLANLKSSSKEIDFVEKMNETQRSFNLVSFNTADYPQSEIEKFGKENAKLFVRYNMNIITLDDKESAETLLARINNEEITFADASTEYSINQYSGDDGVLDNALHYELKNVIVNEEEFNTLVALPMETVSNVIETSTGYSIFSVTAAPIVAEFPNESLTNVVYEYLTVFETGRIEEYFINLAKDFASAALSGYSAALDNFGVTNTVVEKIPLNYGGIPLLAALPTQTVTQLAQAQSNEHFFEQAFSLEKGEYSEPIVLGNEIIVLSLLDEIVEPAGEATLDYMYQYYITQFDSIDTSSIIMASDKLENNLFTAMIENFL